MSTDTEARKAAVERFIERAEDMIASLASPDRVHLFANNSGRDRVMTTAGDIRHLMDAAIAGVGLESKAKAKAKAPACIFCGGECRVAGGRKDRYVLCNGCLAEGPTKPTEAEAISAFLRPPHLPGASKPEPPPSDVAIVRGAISIVADRAGKAWVSASTPECESPAFSKLATADQLDALAALASRVAAEVRAKGGAA